MEHGSTSMIVSVTSRRPEGSEGDGSMDLLRGVKMRPYQHICVLDTIVMNGREYIALAALVDSPTPTSTEEFDIADVAGRDVDHSEVQSTVSLIIPVRKKQKILNNKVEESLIGISLSVAHTMTFEGRSSAICAFGKDCLAMSVDNQILLLKVDTNNSTRNLIVFTGIPTPNGGAVLSLTSSRMGTKNVLLVGEMSGPLSMFVQEKDERRLQLFGIDEACQQGVCRHICIPATPQGHTSVLFCDWATNTLRFVDTCTLTLKSKEIVRLESHAVAVFAGSMLPSPVTLGRAGEENNLPVASKQQFLVVSRDGSIVQSTGIP